MAGPLTPDDPQHAVREQGAVERLRREQLAPVRDLANRYRQGAGQAYASGRDKEAAAFRAAAEDIDALADRLPSLPVATR